MLEHLCFDNYNSQPNYQQTNRVVSYNNIPLLKSDELANIDEK